MFINFCDLNSKGIKKRKKTDDKSCESKRLKMNHVIIFNFYIKITKKNFFFTYLKGITPSRVWCIVGGWDRANPLLSRDG